MLTAYCRSALTGRLVKYNIDGIPLEEIPAAIKEALGSEFTHPAFTCIEGGKDSTKIISAPAMNNNTNEKEPA